MEVVTEVMRRAEVVTVDEATSYYFANTLRGGVPDITEFPNLTPPFPAFFLESQAPGADGWPAEERTIAARSFELRTPRSWGVLFDAVDLSSRKVRENLKARKPDLPLKENTRWLLGAMLFADYSEKEDPEGPIAMWELPIREGGEFERSLADRGELYTTLFNAGGLRPKERELSLDAARAALLPMLFSACCLNCAEVRSRMGDPPALGPPSPQTRKHVGARGSLKMKPLKEFLDSEGNATEAGLGRALDACRSHFLGGKSGSGPLPTSGSLRRLMRNSGKRRRSRLSSSE